ncbi:endolytic transglycosylase MltG [Streptomyces sp. NPDC002055]|uniref:endolytic transglycosylase MltG n=1 Tax=Streptomyces sp. NPDC002055 TaxID=3154534 RepID=UPI00332B3C51
MTEYGRGPGSEPWHPDDPLYGDGWNGQQPQGGAPGPYDGGQHYQQPQWDDGAQQYGPGAGQQQYAQQPYGDQQYGWDPARTTGMAYGGDQGDPYGPAPSGPYPGERPDLYGTPGAYPPQPGHPGQPPYAEPGHPGRPYPEEQPYQEEPYGGPQQYPGQPHETQPFEPPSFEPQQADGPGPDPGAEPGPEAGPAPEPREEHPFFAGQEGRERGRGRYVEGDDEPGGADSDDADRRDRPKRRSGTACLLTGVILVGVLGGVGYLGYDFWQEHFGPAPDYSGQGTGTVQVEIPEGALGQEMGGILQKAGVVKSAGAFVEAQEANPKGKHIQPGVYVLHKKMSGAEAVTMMTDPASFNALIVPEGSRAPAIYAAVDKKLDVPAGTTKKVAAKQADKLGLPEWADDDPDIKDPLEGFLYPSRYSAAEGTKPVDVLRQMVSRAKKEYAKHDLAGDARKLGLKSPLDVVTVASLVQAEGKTDADFRKMSRVVYNRLKPGNTETNGRLEFDSTYNYLKGQSKLDLDPAELRRYDDPYNTYFYKGLTPGPIGNPGIEALNAALNPESGDWYYFVAIKGKTKFASTLEEHNRLVEEFNKSRREDRAAGRG